jgi:hypothetical protein
VDIDSGNPIAVKIIKIRTNQRRDDFLNSLKREVEAIGRIRHVSSFPLGGNKNTRKFTRPETYPG